MLEVKGALVKINNFFSVIVMFYHRTFKWSWLNVCVAVCTTFVMLRFKTNILFCWGRVVFFSYLIMSHFLFDHLIWSYLLSDQTFSDMRFLLSSWSQSLTYSQKQLSGCVLRKRCFENIHQIYRRTPMPKCGFNKVTSNFIEITLGWLGGCDGCSPVNLLHIFKTPFPRNAFGGLPLYWWKIFLWKNITEAYLFKLSWSINTGIQ